MRKSRNDVERIRTWRNRPDRTEAIHDRVLSLARHVERSSKRLSAIIDAWEQVLSSDLAAQTRVRGFRAGVVQVITASSAVLYEVDRRLRAGGTAELIRLTAGAVSRVRITVGPLHDPEMERE